MPPELTRAADEIAGRQRQEEERQRNEEERQRNEEERQRNEEERRQKEEERRLAERKARDMQSALEALARERTGLLDVAPVEPVTEKADWQVWRERGRGGAGRGVDDGERRGAGREHPRGAGGIGGGARARPRGRPRGGGAIPRLAQVLRPIGGRRHMHRFHAPETGVLVERTAALEDRVVQPGEMPGLLPLGLRRPPGRGRKNGAGSGRAGRTWPALPGWSRARRRGCRTRALRRERRHRRSWTTGRCAASTG